MLKKTQNTENRYDTEKIDETVNKNLNTLNINELYSLNINQQLYLINVK